MMTDNPDTAILVIIRNLKKGILTDSINEKCVSEASAESVYEMWDILQELIQSGSMADTVIMQLQEDLVTKKEEHSYVLSEAAYYG